MRSVLLVALSNLRRRKGQALLVGAIIALSVMLFSTGVGLMREIEGPFEEMFEELGGSHYTIIFDSRVHDIDRIRAWWKQRPGVTGVTEAIPVVELSRSSYFQGRQLSKYLFVTERTAGEKGQDELRVVEGRPGTHPGHGKVWVPTSLASDAGIRVGQTLEIPAAEGLRSLEVEAIVVDPQFSAPFNSPVRVWIAPGELPYYFPSLRLNDVMMGVRLRAPERTDELWTAFVRDLGGAFSGKVYDYEGVLAGYTAPYSLMALMLVAFSLLSLLIAVFAIHGTITSAILADFKVIGILRSQGFRPADVRNIYQLQYLALALIAVPLGTVAGVLSVRQSVVLLMSTTGAGIGSASLLLQAGITLLAFLALVYLFVGRVARRAEAIQPADAIRYGAAQEQAVRSGGISIVSLRAFSLPLVIAIKNLVLEKRRAVFLTTSVLFATLAASLAVNLDTSFQRMAGDLALFGWDSADVRVSRTGKRLHIRHEAFMGAMKSRADVAAISTWDPVDGVIAGVGTRGTRSLTGVLIDGDIDGLGFLNLRGRNPHAADEISLAVNTARGYGKDVGDRVDLYLLGRRLGFSVTGVYQSTNNGGEGFRVRLEAIRMASPFHSPTQYGLVLREGVDPDEFIAALETEYGEAIDGRPGDYFVRDTMAAVATGMRMTNGFLVLIFLLASSVFVFNSTLMNIAENRRSFGVLKTVGMTPAQLRASVVYGVGLQASVGIAAGLMLWWLGAGPALSLLFSGLGLVSFPLQNSIMGTALAVPCILAFCLLSAWIPSNRVLRINPRNLIVE
jgi:putative ABC transport system permease protein